MAQHHDMWPVAVLCEVWGVRRSGFYTYRQRQAAPTIARDELAALARVTAIAAETGYSDGSRRMAKQLQAAGCTGGRHTARQLLQPGGHGGTTAHPTAASYDGQSPWRPRGAQPPRTPVRRRSPRSRLGGGYHVGVDCRGLVVCGGTVRSVCAEGGGVGDEQPR